MDYGKEIEAGKTKDTCRLRQIREQVHEEVGRSRKAGEMVEEGRNRQEETERDAHREACRGRATEMEPDRANNVEVGR